MPQVRPQRPRIPTPCCFSCGGSGEPPRERCFSTEGTRPGCPYPNLQEPGPAGRRRRDTQSLRPALRPFPAPPTAGSRELSPPPGLRLSSAEPWTRTCRNPGPPNAPRPQTPARNPSTPPRPPDPDPPGPTRWLVCRRSGRAARRRRPAAGLGRAGVGRGRAPRPRGLAGREEAPDGPRARTTHSPAHPARPGPAHRKLAFRPHLRAPRTTDTQRTTTVPDRQVSPAPGPASARPSPTAAISTPPRTRTRMRALGGRGLRAAAGRTQPRRAGERRLRGRNHGLRAGGDGGSAGRATGAGDPGSPRERTPSLKPLLLVLVPSRAGADPSGTPNDISLSPLEPAETQLHPGLPWPRGDLGASAPRPAARVNPGRRRRTQTLEAPEHSSASFTSRVTPWAQADYPRALNPSFCSAAGVKPAGPRG